MLELPEQVFDVSGVRAEVVGDSAGDLFVISHNWRHLPLYLVYPADFAIVWMMATQRIRQETQSYNNSSDWRHWPHAPL